MANHCQVFRRVIFSDAGMVFVEGHIQTIMETILNTIQRIPYVQSTETMLSLDQAFERQVWVKNFKSTTFRNL